MNILIIENEMPSAKRLAKMISKNIPNANVEGPLASIDEVIENLTVRNNYDLIFSDIQLVDGDVFKAFEKAIEKLELMPNTEQDIYIADKAALNETTSNFDPHNSHTKIQRVLVQEKNRYIPIIVTDIAYIRISERKKVVVTDNGVEYIMSLKNEDIIKHLDTKLFFRLNRNSIINVNSISHITKTIDSRIILHINHYDEEFVLSCERTKNFMNWFYS